MLTTDPAVLNRDLKFLAGISVFLYLIFCFTYPRGGFLIDLGYWMRWTDHISANGLGLAYQGSDVNYNPGYLYLLYAYGKLVGSPGNDLAGIFGIKLLLVLFDIAGALLAGFVFRQHGITPLKAVFILLNMAYLYNTLIWGQLDAVYTFFAAASVAAALYNRPATAVVLMVLSLNVKLQGIIFLPLLGILLLPAVVQHPARTVGWVLAGLATQVILLVPFMLAGQLSAVWGVVTGAVDFYAVVSLNAYNLWFLVLPGDLLQIPDSLKYLGLSYKHWGLLLFCLASAVVLVPVLLVTAVRGVKRVTLSVADVAGVFLAGALIALCFFYFNTQMHERYSHPALLFAGIYAFLRRDYLFYGVVSVAYFLNLEGVLKYLNLYDHPTLIFDPRFISGLFLLALIWGLVKLYRLFPVTESYRLLFAGRISRNAATDIVGR